MNEKIAKKSSILIVDDNPNNIQVAANILKDHGYKVSFDIDGKKVLQHIKSVKSDLILLDIMMPEMDGYEVCRRLKDNPETKDIPIIFLTAKTDTESIVRGFKAGGVDYITKPFNKEELLARVNTHLELKRHRDHLEAMVRERTETIRVMMEIREEISAGVEEKITANIRMKMLPMLQKFKISLLTNVQKDYLDIIESGLDQILSEFTQKLASPSFNLTPAELQIADLIKEGKNGKEIAELLNTSESAVNFHRNNIRKKLGLINQKSNLKLFLQSLD